MRTYKVWRKGWFEGEYPVPEVLDEEMQVPAPEPERWDFEFSSLPDFRFRLPLVLQRRFWRGVRRFLQWRVTDWIRLALNLQRTGVAGIRLPSLPEKD